MKTLITFVHFNRPNQSLYRDNLDFFIKAGLTDSPEHHFNIILNSDPQGEDIPIRKNVSVIKGHNKNQDWGAYHQSIHAADIKKYDYFIFINDTCRGPFLPTYLPQNFSWVDLFLNKLDDKVKMVGPTWFNEDTHPWLINSLNIKKGKMAHIQSYCFGVDKKALTLLLENNKFDVIGKSWKALVRNHEIGCSQLLLEKGYQIKPFQLSHYGNQKNEDVCHNGGYYGMNINPIEVMFFKTIGSSLKDKIAPHLLNNYTEWILHEKKK
jgi:hypothetical protein